MFLLVNKLKNIIQFSVWIPNVPVHKFAVASLSNSVYNPHRKLLITALKFNRGVINFEWNTFFSEESSLAIKISLLDTN